MTFVGGSSYHIRSFYAVHTFSRWSSREAFLLTAHLPIMCVGRLEREESSVVSELDDVHVSVAENGQTPLVLVAEDTKHYPSFKLS
ncbi:hypothetical protein QL285_083372 [Trifolium repens]|nr:hypothetical protein QL285_083372 [Trifolium repens]